MMTNEEWNRKIEFILNQQAKFDADMQELNQKLNQELKEAEAKAAKAAERTEKSLSQLADATLELIATMTAGFRSSFDHIKHSNERIDVLVNSQMQTDERILDSYKRMKETEKTLWEHDKRFQDLTAQFERHLRKYHRGGNASEN
jgi:chromosome condensin MukBEF ATPase and DNA-binding subunit MukB